MLLFFYLLLLLEVIIVFILQVQLNVSIGHEHVQIVWDEGEILND